ncbi:hypothetical protein G6F40_016497 [Rhizopus arrhizus]|nr:hypothetical protein G6F40_016497 [Rhizopus arrhizus]
MAGREHHADQGQASHIVAGAVDGVDQKGQVGVDQHVQQGGIARGGLFADPYGAGVPLGQAGGDQAFSRLVRVGHQVARRTLAPHRAFRQVAIAWHALRQGGFGQHGGKLAGVLAGKSSAHTDSSRERANLSRLSGN